MADEPSRGATGRRAAGRWGAAAAAGVVAAWVFGWGSQVLVGDAGATAARYQVSQWLHGDPAKATDDALNQAQQALEQALVRLPMAPELHDRLASLHLVRAWRLPPGDPRATALLQRAAAGYEAMIAQRPTDPWAWAMLALARQQAGAPDGAIFGAWTRARALGPYERHLEPVLWQVVVARWDMAPAAARQWAEALFEASSDGRRQELNQLARPFGLQFATR